MRIRGENLGPWAFNVWVKGGEPVDKEDRQGTLEQKSETMVPGSQSNETGGGEEGNGKRQCNRLHIK